MAVVHAILAEITRTLGEPARAAMRATEDLWSRLDLMCD
jgi:hypothetical protein